jgi:hypothetical protein
MAGFEVTTEVQRNHVCAETGLRQYNTEKKELSVWHVASVVILCRPVRKCSLRIPRQFRGFNQGVPENSKIEDLMAERVGFEPTGRLLGHTLSKRAPSATRTPLHGLVPQGRNLTARPVLLSKLAATRSV